MDIVYSPHREKYITSSKKDDDKCVFCEIVTNKDDEKLGVLKRYDDFFVVMNKYPYSPGHFMVIPNLHTDKLENLDPKIWAKMALCAQDGVKMLKDILNASGVNIGMNLGKSAGAGIEAHIHMHLVPRWIADTNFITTIADTRIYGSDFQSVYEKLKSNTDKYLKNEY